MGVSSLIFVLIFTSLLSSFNCHFYIYVIILYPKVVGVRRDC